MTEKTTDKIENPRDYIRYEDVKTALEVEKGDKAKLKSFSIKDFTSAGDNHMGCVTSVIVDYFSEEKVKKTSYIVKLNPCKSANFDAMTKVTFEKEIGFYKTVLPLLNAELERANEERLRLPKFFHYIEKDGEEVIYLEDLRNLGYKMLNRKQGMDKDHSELVLVELGRLHAASSLLMSRGKFQGANIIEKFPVLDEAFTAIDEADNDMSLEKLLSGLMDSGAKIAARSEGYERVEAFLSDKKSSSREIFYEQLRVAENFKIICHGDCWSNNFLFRYSKDGKVEECRLIDFQLTRVASPALDLNYMFYCSLTGEMRQAQFVNFLLKYYATFASVVAGAGSTMKFSFSQLWEEFYKKNAFGLLMSLMLIPMILVDTENTIEVEDLVEGGDDNKILDEVHNNPLLAPRLLSMFDDMLENNTII